MPIHSHSIYEIDQPKQNPNPHIDVITHHNQTSLITYQRYQRSGHDDFYKYLLDDLEACFWAENTQSTNGNELYANFLNYHGML